MEIVTKNEPTDDKEDDTKSPIIRKNRQRARKIILVIITCDFILTPSVPILEQKQNIMKIKIENVSFIALK